MSEERIKFCVVCGRRIPELSMRKKTCGPICSNKKKNGYAPYINYDRPPYEDLTKLQQMAHQKGLSYGKFMAIYSGKEGEVKHCADGNAMSLF